MSYEKIIKYGVYFLLINTTIRTISIYNPCCREEILTKLPLGIKWENLELILDHEDKGLTKDLARKIIEFQQ